MYRIIYTFICSLIFFAVSCEKSSISLALVIEMLIWLILMDEFGVNEIE